MIRILLAIALGAFLLENTATGALQHHLRVVLGSCPKTVMECPK